MSYTRRSQQAAGRQGARMAPRGASAELESQFTAFLTAIAEDRIENPVVRNIASEIVQFVVVTAAVDPTHDTILYEGLERRVGEVLRNSGFPGVKIIDSANRIVEHIKTNLPTTMNKRHFALRLAGEIFSHPIFSAQFAHVVPDVMSPSNVFFLIRQFYAWQLLPNLEAIRDIDFNRDDFQSVLEVMIRAEGTYPRPIVNLDMQYIFIIVAMLSFVLLFFSEFFDRYYLGLAGFFLLIVIFLVVWYSTRNNFYAPPFIRETTFSQIERLIREAFESMLPQREAPQASSALVRQAQKLTISQSTPAPQPTYQAHQEDGESLPRNPQHRRQTAGTAAANEVVLPVVAPAPIALISWNCAARGQFGYDPTQLIQPVLQLDAPQFQNNIFVYWDREAIELILTQRHQHLYDVFEGLAMRARFCSGGARGQQGFVMRGDDLVLKQLSRTGSHFRLRFEESFMDTTGHCKLYFATRLTNESTD